MRDQTEFGMSVIPIHYTMMRGASLTIFMEFSCITLQAFSPGNDIDVHVVCGLSFCSLF